MNKISIAPLSVNKAYRGRRFLTREHYYYKNQLMALLPKIVVPEGKLELWYIFGFSSKNSDVDNCVKIFQDCIAEAYGFNDKAIHRFIAEKVDVPKGQEFIGFSIKSYV